MLMNGNNMPAGTNHAEKANPNSQSTELSVKGDFTDLRAPQNSLVARIRNAIFGVDSPELAHQICVRQVTDAQECLNREKESQQRIFKKLNEGLEKMTTAYDKMEADGELDTLLESHRRSIGHVIKRIDSKQKLLNRIDASLDQYQLALCALDEAAPLPGADLGSRGLQGAVSWLLNARREADIENRKVEILEGILKESRNLSGQPDEQLKLAEPPAT